MMGLMGLIRPMGPITIFALLALHESSRVLKKIPVNRAEVLTLPHRKFADKMDYKKIRIVEGILCQIRRWLRSLQK
jgi:hypothetical protein